MHQIQVLRSQAQFLTVKDLLEHILDDTGYRAELNAEKTIESHTRLENLQVLINEAADLHDEPEDAEALRAALRKTPLEGDSPAARGVENLLARLENPKQKLWDWNPAPPPQAGKPFLWRRRKA